MALPSQSGQSSGGRRYMASRGRKRMRLGKLAVVALVVVAAGYMFWPDGDNAQDGQAQTATTVADSSISRGTESATGPGAVPGAANVAGAGAARKKIIDLTVPAPPKTPPTNISRNKATTPATSTKPRTRTASATRHQADNQPHDKPNTPVAQPQPQADPKPQPKPIASVTEASKPAEKKPDPPVLSVRVPSKPTKLVPDPKPAPATADALAPPMPRYTGEPGSALAKGLAMVDEGKLIEGRDALSDLLVRGGPELSARGAETIRETLSRINGALIFSPRVYAADPLATEYVVQGGDLLLRVARKFGVSYQFLEQINGISARRIRPGQRLKVIRGPFHAVVSKSEYRMDMFLVGPDEKMVYVRSFPVGLGEEGSTPIGRWIARRDGKLENPSWTDPRTNKYFAPDNPMNPIGEFWIGLKGTDDVTKTLSGYGIHGTVEPESIGQSASRGCVRMYADDIAMTYRMLVGGKSTVVIQP